jgi:UDP-glucose 4-epimerase
MSSVLITGGMGVIGAWVTRQMVEQGVQVVTYSRHLDFMLLKDIADKFEGVVGDIQDLPRLINTINQYKVERIIHLSSLMPGHAEANPYMGYQVNVEGSINVLEAARLTNTKRVVATSSKAVYDVTRGEYDHPTYKPLDENYPKAPNTVYGTTKVFMENMCQDYSRVYGMDIVILRFPSPYGIGRQARHGVVAVTSKVIESAMLKHPLSLPQGADQKDDFTYHRDIANGIVLACFAENLEHSVFNIGTGKGETLPHMVEALNKVLGEVPITIGPGLNFLERPGKGLRYSVFNIDRARKELGYAPRYDLVAGVRDYIEWMERLGIQPEVVP